MKTLLWTHTGYEGQIIIRMGDGAFVPKERIVEIEVLEENTPQEIYDKVQDKYKELGIPLEYHLGI
jgi:hypothetical protein